MEYCWINDRLVALTVMFKKRDTQLHGEKRQRLWGYIFREDEINVRILREMIRRPQETITQN